MRCQACSTHCSTSIRSKPRRSAGTIVPTALNEIFDRMREEFGYHAEAKALALKVVRCSQLIETDPRLLEQVLRNLLTNAIKYTRSGKVLLGCRRRGGVLSIEIWDTGIGIPEAELRTIFMEYHQLDNAARESNRGLAGPLHRAAARLAAGLQGSCALAPWQGVRLRHRDRDAVRRSTNRASGSSRGFRGQAPYRRSTEPLDPRRRG